MPCSNGYEVFLIKSPKWKEKSEYRYYCSIHLYMLMMRKTILGFHSGWMLPDTMVKNGTLKTQEQKSGISKLKEATFGSYYLSKEAQKIDSNLPEILFWYFFFPELSSIVLVASMFETYLNAKPTQRSL